MCLTDRQFFQLSAALSPLNANIANNRQHVDQTSSSGNSDNDNIKSSKNKHSLNATIINIMRWKNQIPAHCYGAVRAAAKRNGGQHKWP